MSPRRALVTGITGQDSSYLAQLLLAKCYEVHGMVRRSSCLRIDPRFLRPAEVEHLIGDASQAREKLGWEPRTSFEEFIV